MYETCEYYSSINGKRLYRSLLSDAEISTFFFAYFDEDSIDMGAPIAAVDLGDIRSIEFSLTLQEPAGRNEPVERTLTQRVLCRNLGL